MSFNEKSAIVMILALLVGSIGYLSAIAELYTSLGELPAPTVPTLIRYAGCLLFIAVAGHIIITAYAPTEADAPADERDRLVQTRASHYSGWCLAFGVITGMIHYLYHQNGNWLFYSVYLSLVISQLVEYLLQLYFYRMRAG